MSLKNKILSLPFAFELNAYRGERKLSAYYKGLRSHYNKMLSVACDTLLASKVQQYNITFRYNDKLRILFFYGGSGSWLDLHFRSTFARFGECDELVFVDKPVLTQQEVDSNGRILSSYLVKKRDYDVIIIGGSEGHIPQRALTETMNRYHIPILNFQFDPKQRFKKVINGVEHGSIEAAKGTLLTFTNAKYVVDWYLKEGCPAVYLAAGSNPDIYFSDPSVCKDIDVAFFGAKYGRRAQLVEYLAKNGINARGYGPGWDSGYLSFEKQNQLMQRTKIALSHEGIGYSYWPTCIKLRTFDTALAGTVLLTSYSSELPDWFRLNEEILCYYNFDDAVDIARYYLARPAELGRIAKAAQKRGLNEHTWWHRFDHIFGLLEAHVRKTDTATKL